MKCLVLTLFVFSALSTSVWAYDQTAAAAICEKHPAACEEFLNPTIFIGDSPFLLGWHKSGWREENNSVVKGVLNTFCAGKGFNAGYASIQSNVRNAEVSVFVGQNYPSTGALNLPNWPRLYVSKVLCAK